MYIKPFSFDIAIKPTLEFRIKYLNGHIVSAGYNWERQTLMKKNQQGNQLFFKKVIVVGLAYFQ